MLRWRRSSPASSAGQRQPPRGQGRFGDDDGNVHEPSINSLAALNIVRGFGDRDDDGREDYDPSGKVTRAQMATFIAGELRLLVRNGDAHAGGAEVFLDATTAAPGQGRPGRVLAGKQLQSLTPKGCGVDGAVSVNDQGEFTITLPDNQQPGECRLTLTGATTNGRGGVQRVPYVFELNVSR